MQAREHFTLKIRFNVSSHQIAYKSWTQGLECHPSASLAIFLYRTLTVHHSLSKLNMLHEAASPKLIRHTCSVRYV